MNKLHKTIAMMASSLLVLLGFGCLYKLQSQHARLKDAIENRAKVYGPPPARVTVIKK